MIKQALLITITLFLTQLVSFAQPTGPIDVLFLGNSFTFYQDLPNMFKGFAESTGKQVSVDSYTPGGRTLEGDVVDPDAMAKVKSKAWTYLVLQGWAGNSVTDDMTRFGTQIMDAYRTVNPNGKVIMYMVHGTTPYPSLAEMNAQQADYEAITKARPYATLAPAMWAWRQGYIEDPVNSRWLSSDDNWHPGDRRTYISAATIYSTIYQTSPIGNTKKDFVINFPYTNRTLSFNTNDLPYLQQLSWDAVQKYGGSSTLPYVTFTSPSNGASFATPATITLTATATGNNSTVTKVEFYAGTTLIGTTTTSPYTFSWSNMAVGTYSLSAKVTDSKNSISTSSAVNVSVYNNDGSGKLQGTSIGSPGSYDGISTSDKALDGNLTTYFDATSADGQWVGLDLGSAMVVSTVKFAPRTTMGSRMIGGKIQGSNSADFAGAVDLYTVTSIPTDGILTIAALTNAAAYRYVRYLSPNAGWGNIAEVEFYGKTTNKTPICIITSPVNNSKISLPVDITITADASDADGNITKVEFYNGTTLLGTSTSSPFAFAWKNVPAGNHTLSAKASDNSGNTSVSAIISINTHQAFPTCVITTPVTNSTFEAPANIPITVSAASTSGSVTKVEFYNGAILLETVTTSPYTYTWSNVSVGNYTITGRAFDNYGGFTDTKPIGIVVSRTGGVGTTNLLLTNPSFESETAFSFANGAFNGITGWDLFNSAYYSIGVNAGNAQEGNNKLNLNYAGKAETFVTNRANVTAGKTYTLSMAISKSGNTNTAIQSPVYFQINWYNASNVLISSTSSGVILGGAVSAWNVYSVKGIAPANVVKASCFVELQNTPYPNQDVASFLIDNVVLSQESMVTAVSNENIPNTGFDLSIIGNTQSGIEVLVASNTTETVEAVIIDMAGKVLIELPKLITNQTTAVSNSILPGVYALQVAGRNGIKSKLFLIK